MIITIEANLLYLYIDYLSTPCLLCSSRNKYSETLIKYQIKMYYWFYTCANFLHNFGLVVLKIFYLLTLSWVCITVYMTINIKNIHSKCRWILCVVCGYGSVVEFLLAKEKMRVRFPLPAMCIENMQTRCVITSIICLD